MREAKFNGLTMTFVKKFEIVIFWLIDFFFVKGNKSGYQLESIIVGYCRSINTCYFERLHKLDFGDQIYDYFCLKMNLVCIVLVPV